MSKLKKECVIVKGVECDGCNTCNMCDIDPTKVCDNCMKCLDEGDYNAVIIESIITDSN